MLAGLSRALSLNLTFSNLWEVEDTLVCLLANNFTVIDMLDPATAAGSVLVPYLVSLHNFAAYDAFDGLQERLLTGGPLLTNIMQRMQARASPGSTDPLKVQLFSAHDTTVSAFLSALDPNHFGFGAPPYCAAVVVELRRMGDGSFVVWFGLKNRTLSGLWNETVFPLTIPYCSEYCPLTTLTQLTLSMMVDDIAEACKPLPPSPASPPASSPSAPSPAQSSSKSAYIAVGVILPLVAVGIVATAYAYYQKQSSLGYRFFSGRDDGHEGRRGEGRRAHRERLSLETSFQDD